MLTICSICKKAKKCDYAIISCKDNGFLKAKEEEEKYRICEECKIKAIS